MANVTLKIVAKAAGVSPSTVSRILSNDQTCYIGKEKKNAVLETVKKLGYTPNLQARNLVLGRSSTIALVIHRFAELESTGLILPKYIEGIESKLKEHGFVLSITTLSPQIPGELQRICSATHQYGGLIFGGGLIPENGVEVVANSAVPSIALEDISPYLKGVANVRSDIQGGVDQAIAHLKNLGHEAIAYYGFSENMSKMFRNALAQNNLHSKEDLLFLYSSRNPYYSMLDSFFLADRFIEHISKISAVFCAGGFIAIGLCRRLKQAGVVPGKDISILCCDNIEPMLEEDKAFLTTIGEPREEVGQRIAQRLIETIETKNRDPREELLPCQLIIRNSTGPNIKKS